MQLCWIFYFFLIYFDSLLMPSVFEILQSGLYYIKKKKIVLNQVLQRLIFGCTAEDGGVIWEFDK